MVTIPAYIGGWQVGEPIYLNLPDTIIDTPQASITNQYSVESAESAASWFKGDYTFLCENGILLNRFGISNYIMTLPLIIWVGSNNSIEIHRSGSIYFRYKLGEDTVLNKSISSSDYVGHTLCYVPENTTKYVECAVTATNQSSTFFSSTYGCHDASAALINFWAGVQPVPRYYNVTYHLVHATGDSANPTIVPVEQAEGSQVWMRFSSTEGYSLKYASVPIGTGYGPDDSVIYAWNAERGEMMINGFTSDITVEVIGVVDPYPIPNSDTTDPSTIDPTSKDYDFSSTKVPIPANPSWSYGQAGFSNVYLPTEQQLNRLALYLWSGSFDADNFKKMFNNPMEAIMGCHLVPLSIDDISHTNGTLAYGNNDTGIAMYISTSNWVSFDCQSIKVPIYYGSYMSYSPYTKIQIYLPYIGTHYLHADDVVGKWVHVIYKIDIVSGACVALIGVGEEQGDETVMYQFTGQCSAEIPVTQGDYKNILQTIQSVVSSSVGVVNSAVTGRNTKTGSGMTKSGAAGLIGAGFSAVGALGSSIEDMIKPDISMSGNVSGSAGFLGVQKPYLFISTPRVCLPEEQATFMGLPTYVTATLGDLNGFTQCEAIHLDGFSLTEPELEELHDMLKEGVIF